MLRFIGLFFAFALVSSKNLPPGARIIGGTAATIEDNPWQVSLEAFGNHNCGGSIIGPTAVLTAAHCVEGLIAPFYQVVSGTANLKQNGKRTSIQNILMHEDYDGSHYDVAILTLTESLEFDETTQAVPLANEEPSDGEVVRVTGWGLLDEADTKSPDILYTVDVNIVSRSRCEAVYANVDDAYIDDTTICAGVTGGGKDSCSGDSGGPLTRNGTLVGIVSWGDGCGKPGYPGVYTNVAFIRDWIKTNSGVFYN